MSRTAEAESHAVLPYRGGPTLRPRQPSTTTPSPLVMDDRETSTSKNLTAQPSPSAMPRPASVQQGCPGIFPGCARGDAPRERQPYGEQRCPIARR